jgi:hypothetical protein
MYFDAGERRSLIQIINEHEKKDERIMKITEIVDDELSKSDDLLDLELINCYIQYLYKLKGLDDTELSVKRINKNIINLKRLACKNFRMIVKGSSALPSKSELRGGSAD